MRTLFPILALSALALGGCRSSGAEHSGRENTIHVFAAASLTDVLEAMADSFETSVEGAPEVLLNLAGSSLLARQIEHGAGADVFVSAHPTWTTYLHEGGFLRVPGELPMSNRLVLATRDSGRILADVERLALADPGHVPAGIYARGALECAQLWDLLEARTAATVDVRAALAAVEEGAADAAIVYGSDAQFAPNLYISEPFADTCQPVISYTIGVTPSAGAGAERFAAFVSDTMQATTWEAFGFSKRRAVPPLR